MQFRPSRDENAGPFDLKWILKSKTKWKFTLRCFNVNTCKVKLCEEEQLGQIILTLTLTFVVVIICAKVEFYFVNKCTLMMIHQFPFRIFSRFT